MVNVQAGRASVGEAVDLAFAGDRGEGPHRCAECGYGISMQGELPRCPMCSGETWEPDVRKLPLPHA